MGIGKVWLLGAGPGDTGLFTIKGRQVLEEADVVIYDRLVGQGILAMAPKNARFIDAGKCAGNHTLPQEKINRILVEEARKGNKVVRLKGGDPFLFGRGGEELELLVKNHIPYEVVPGVTSSIAVPAYNGIPVTHRDFCSSLHIITGHKKAGQTYHIDFEALVRTEGTLVFLMGVSSLNDICKGLIEAGMNPMMPAAILQKGTTAGQRRIVATVSTLYQEILKQGIQTPAIIIVGQVCQLADEFAWYEALPLAGYKVLVTRPKDLISSMAEKLRQNGAEVIELPSIFTERIEKNQKLKNAFEHIHEYQWLVLTSPTGANVFFQELKEAELDIRKLHHLKIAVIGSGTQKVLEEKGLFADLIPEVFDGVSLGNQLAKNCQSGEKVMLPRASLGGKELVEELEKANIIVDDIATYVTKYQTQDFYQSAVKFDEGEIDCVVFTSASTVRGFVNSVEGIDFSKVKAACIGKQTKAQADSYGMETYVAKEASIDSLIELVIQLKNIRKDSGGSQYGDVKKT
ncbi:uroporphyrinogen-III C-methyltransferase [Anaerosacchariphilus polymeriproducens]|uniref:uroporphyrinogen-III C-methyltransferase n=1 Tax=Anaerosacchariphilus polymeriproducens TaxID=1812858 RepID=A0A371AYB2_9FIRM|nr:uroporphyrinogen-III C-methyltransferase [Anaerosacchariphilus polymeriproducens]RDU24551.1 uroporphyrinogen-III C-methyltransferase [Anaerosacchariphilus polymeriproducens]